MAFTQGPLKGPVGGQATQIMKEKKILSLLNFDFRLPKVLVKNYVLLQYLRKKKVDK